MVRRVQVETHDITDFLNEERITGELEVLGAMRLNGKRLEDAMDSRLRESIRIGGLTNTPVAACWRLVLQSAAEQQSYLLIRYRARPARSEFIVKTKRRSTKRWRHLPTVALVPFNWNAISVLDLPSADHNTSFARATRA